MPLGPVFNAELLTTARRGRYYALRTIYGLLVLFQIYVVYSSSYRYRMSGTELSIREMANFAATIFTSFASLQGAVVLLLTPALVGGVIADERQRKTLHYLLTSRLGGGEIVLGKLAARLLQLGVFLAMGLPVVSLIGLFGGVDPLVIALTYAGTVTSMYFLATLSIFVSVHARVPREAIASIYLFGIVWLILPPLFLALIPLIRPDWWAVIGPVVGPALEWVAISSPTYLIRPGTWGGGTSLVEAIAWMMGSQVVYGSILAALAALRLRPAFRRIEGGGRKWADRMRWITAKKSWLPRPPCGDDAMLWKERYVSRTAGLAKVSSLVLGLALFGLVGWAGYYFVEPVVREILAGNWSDTGSGNRRELHGFLIGVTVVGYVLWILGVGSAAAAGVSAEREGDTWISLVTSPLTGAEILRAKMVGAAWSFRVLAFGLFAAWGVGLALGAIHPLGALLCLVEFAAFTWFLVALGTSISLRSKNSTRALAGTMATLVLVNGGYLFCCIPLRADTPLILCGCTPAIFGGSLIDYPTAGQLFEGSLRNALGREWPEFLAAGVICFTGYTVAAVVLTGQCFAAFDAVVDRPDRTRRPIALPRSSAKPKPSPASAGGLE